MLTLKRPKQSSLFQMYKQGKERTAARISKNCCKRSCGHAGKLKDMHYDPTTSKSEKASCRNCHLPALCANDFRVADFTPRFFLTRATNSLGNTTSKPPSFSSASTTV